MTLAERCNGLLSLTETDWAAYALLREPLRGRLTQESYRPFYERAAACGRDEARQLKRAFPRISVWEIAAALGVEVREVPLPQGGRLAVFASFTRAIQSSFAARTPARRKPFSMRKAWTRGCAK